MSCDIAIGANRGKQCDNTQGGYKNLYFFNYVDDAFTLTSRVATALSGLTGETVYKYEIEGDGNTFTEDSVTDKKIGTKVNTQTLVAQLKKIDAVTNVELDKLSKGKMSAVIEDYNGTFQWIAEDSFNVTMTVQKVSGGARNEFNGYNVTAVAETLDSAPTLDASTATAFVALVAS